MLLRSPTPRIEFDLVIVNLDTGSLDFKEFSSFEVCLFCLLGPVSLFLFCVGVGDSFKAFTCLTSSLPIVFDRSIIGLEDSLDDLKESLPKVFRNNTPPGDIGLLMFGLGGRSSEGLS